MALSRYQVWEPGVGDGAAITSIHSENSDVLLFGSVAVAVMKWPTGTVSGKVTEKLASPLPLVVTSVEPRKFSPSPYPVGSDDASEKNSSLNSVLAMLFSVPSMVMLRPIGYEFDCFYSHPSYTMTECIISIKRFLI